MTSAYCVKCRQSRNMVDEHIVMTANNHRSIQGTCPICGTKMSVMTKNVAQ